MQTFLPFADFYKSASVLDRNRLGNQRRECKVLLTTLLGSGGWKHHPAAKMWKGYEAELCRYAIAICKTWRARGYKDQQLPYFQDILAGLPDKGKPSWLGRKDFHASHRSNLLRKKPEYYNQFNWSEPDDLPYVWPI